MRDVTNAAYWELIDDLVAEYNQRNETDEGVLFLHLTIREVVLLLLSCAATSMVREGLLLKGEDEFDPICNGLLALSRKITEVQKAQF